MGHTLRVLSANLWNGRADPDGVAGLIESLGVDVAAFQELSVEQAEAIGAVMPHGVLEPGRRFDGMGIALRRPAKPSRIAMPYRDARVAELHPDDWPELTTPLEIVNVHISAPQCFLPMPGLFLRPGQVRALERHIVEQTAAQRLVVGDFNATPGWPVYDRIRSHLTDAAVAVAERAGRPVRATWGPWSGSPRLLRIDHAFVQGLAVHAFEVVDVPGGDHSAIVMEVSPGREVGAGGRETGGEVGAEGCSSVARDLAAGRDELGTGAG